MARSINCECSSNLTCRDCLVNTKPYFFTLSDGSAIYETTARRGVQTDLTSTWETGEPETSEGM